MIGGSSQLTLVRKMLTDVLPNATIDTCGEKDIAVALGNVADEQIIMNESEKIATDDDKNDASGEKASVIYDHEDDGVLTFNNW